MNMNVRFEVALTGRWHRFANIFEMIPPGPAFDALQEDIRANGIHEPIVVYQGEILDGRNRYMAARDLGVRFPVRDFEGTEAEALAFVMSRNLHRRHLTQAQKVAAAAQAANMPVGGNQHGASLRQLADPPEAVITTQQAAEAMGVATRTVERAKKVVKEGAPELVAAMAAGKVAVSAAAEIAELPKAEQAEVVARGETEILAAAKKIRTEKAKVRKAETEAVRANAAPAPVGSYNVIVLDPPWPMEKIERDVAPNQVAFDYPTMTEAEMAALSLPAADDCHVFTWTTHKFLPMALRLMDAWGVRYVLTMVWHKPGGFQPFGLPQYNCEFAIYGRIGTPKFIDTKAFPTCFNAPRGAHSEKPQEFYDILARVTDGRRLDMFNRRLIDGFDGWGNESVAVAS